ncbi:MAG: glycosyltransferase [Chitinophagaceae bacterium]|nr:glycosyltransferase [Chitinophagaceae bacterium]
MPHILFISYDGLTDPLGQSQVIPYLKGLSGCGFRFTILSAEKPDRFLQQKEAIGKILEESGIKWHPVTYHKWPPIISTIWDTQKMKRDAVRLHKKDPFDMVHTRSGTPALVGVWLKKKLGVKFLNDIRDFYADSRVDSGQWNQKKPAYRMVYRYFKKKEKEQLKLSDGIVCLTQAAKKILLKNIGNTDLPFQVIPCSVDMNLFDPSKIPESSRQEYKTKLGIRDDDLIVSYLGSIGTWYLADKAMQYFKIFSEKNPSAKLLFICPDPKEEVLKIAKEVGLSPNKLVILKAKRTEVPVLLSLSKYSVFFIKPCFSKQASSPTKHGEIMAMGIPLVTNSGVGDLEEIITKTNSGLLINNFTNEELTSIAFGMRLKSFDSAAIRKSAFEYYDLDKAIEKYINIYNRILVDTVEG